MQKVSVCFATDVDLAPKKLTGDVMNDRKLLQCLRQLCNVDVIYLQKTKYKSIWLALPFLVFDIIRSFSKSHRLYFSRGLVTSFVIVSLKTFFKHRKLVHRTQTIRLSLIDQRYAGYGRIESFVRYSLFLFLERMVFSKTDAIAVPALSYAEELMKNNVERNQIFVIPYYVEDEFFRQPIKFDSNEVFTFCYVGGFHRYHDLFPLIEAFAKVSQADKSVKLILVGDGVQRPKMEKEVMERRLGNRITFTGRLPHSSIPAVLSRVDCFIHLARASGISTGLLEAAAAGKPIISLKKEDPTLTQFFRHEKEIYLVNTLSPTEIAEALKSIMDTSLRNQLAEGARRVAKEHFSEEATLRKLRIVMNKMLKPSRKGKP